MSITMVKKILLDGSPCPKCAQAEGILRKRGYWDNLDSVVLAREGESDSEGMKLAAEYKIDLAPFFVVSEEGQAPRIYTRVFEFIKKELEPTELIPKNSESPVFNIEVEARRYADMDPADILADAQSRFGSDLVLAFSGAEDVVLIDLASRNGLPFRVFCLDTGRLHPETYEYLDRVRNHYGIAIEVFVPDPELLQPFVAEKGLNSFYTDGHGECCGIRKVEPLKRALKSRLAWATGLRRDQSPSTRAGLAHVEADPVHLNVHGQPLMKFNPMLDWSSTRVWDHIRFNNLPYNPLHDRGFISIGCAPCTRASRPGEHERAARWWWENETKRECGLHVR